VSGAAAQLPKGQLTIEEYLAWAETDPPGRHELVEGIVVAMAPERVRHNRAKLAMAVALENAVAKARLTCMVFTDGVGVRTGPKTLREPDASVQCHRPADLDSMVLEAPVIVVEVVSPSSGLSDTGRKLVEYFGVPSIQRYLIVQSELGAIVHHRRRTEGDVLTTIHRGGTIRLDPPGLDLGIDALIAAGRGEEVQ
jgi:Uma2 family endonuclease